MSFTDYDKCSLLLPMNGANNGTTFTDFSKNARTVTVSGNAKTSTSQYKYYDSSGYFDGTGDYLSVTGEAFSTGDFTVGIYFRCATPSSAFIIFDSRDSNTSTIGFLLYVNSSSKLEFGTGNPFVGTAGTTTISADTWYYAEVRRIGSTVSLSLNGTVEATVSNSSDFSHTAWKIGHRWNAEFTYSVGYLQDLIIFKGIGYWTSNFTPPARLVGEVSGNTKDDNGDNAARIVTAYPRSYPLRGFTTTSDSGTGNYLINAPATECTIVALANDATLYNDKVERVIPV